MLLSFCFSCVHLWRSADFAFMLSIWSLVFWAVTLEVLMALGVKQAFLHFPVLPWTSASACPFARASSMPIPSNIMHPSLVLFMQMALVLLLLHMALFTGGKTSMWWTEDYLSSSVAFVTPGIKAPHPWDLCWFFQVWTEKQVGFISKLALGPMVLCDLVNWYLGDGMGGGGIHLSQPQPWFALLLWRLCCFFGGLFSVSWRLDVCTAWTWLGFMWNVNICTMWHWT